jgi:hypothetical protein
LYCKVYICKLGKGKEKQSPLRPLKEELAEIEAKKNNFNFCEEIFIISHNNLSSPPSGGKQGFS